MWTVLECRRDELSVFIFFIGSSQKRPSRVRVPGAGFDFVSDPGELFLFGFERRVNVCVEHY
jgi:hypothetical protein